MGAPAHAAIGKYELLLELGRGGMGVLSLARLQSIGGFVRLFAIKRILPHLAADPLFVDMFVQESRIAGRLTHPNVCTVFELGRDGDELFLVMEYLDGVPWETLAAALDGPRGSPPPGDTLVDPRPDLGPDPGGDPAPDPRADHHAALRLGLAAGVLAQACEGLHAAHSFRDVDGNPTPIVHRDVSPQNLFVSVDGVCRVLDFGVSKIASDHRRTRTGVRKGKLPYMAPEQIRGESLDGRADVWAVGVLLWEALTGVRLFDRDTDFLIYQAITELPIPSVNDGAAGHRGRYPDAVDRAIARALARDRDQRYPTALELGRDLLQVAADAGIATSRDAIADAVAQLCGDQLAARRQTISAAIAERDAAAAAARHTTTAPGPDVRTADIPAARDAAETASMAMRRDAIVVAPRRARRWLVPAVALAAAAAAIVAGTAAIAAWRHEPAIASPASPASPMSGASPVSGPSQPGPVPAGEPTRSTSIRSTAAPGPGPSGAIAGGSPGGAMTGGPAVRAGSAPAGSVAGGAPHRSTAAAATRPGAAPSGAVESAPHPGGTSHTAAGERGASAATLATGWYAVDSTPYATIFIDNRKIGDTPLDRIALPAGRHRVRAVLGDGRERTFAVDIAADHKFSSGTLTW